MTDELEILQFMYQANATMRQHHEEQREKVTQLIILMGGALLGWISNAKFIPETRPIAFFVVLLGFFGWLISEKHYERSRRHIKIADAFRDKIDKLVPQAELKTLRDNGLDKHKKDFPRLQRVHLHVLWRTLSLLISAAGLACLVYSIVK